MKMKKTLMAVMVPLGWMAGLLPAWTEETVELEAMTIKAEQAAVQPGSRLSGEALRATRDVSVADAITDLPGVSAVRRGAGGGEPVIRGLGWERVQTQLGCLPVYGACPARMDPPAAYVSPDAVEAVDVIKALPSVTLGPGGTAGRVVMNPDYDRGKNPGSGYEGEAKATWHEGRDGGAGSTFVQGGTDAMDLRATAGGTSLNDYESGGGVTVPANVDELSAAISLGYRPGEGQRVFGSVVAKQEEQVDFPSLPMDIEESTATLTLWGYRINREGQAMERFEVGGGYAYVDHVMNNERKGNRGMVEAETPSEAISASAKVDMDFRVAPTVLLTTGVDAETLERDATRTRRVVAMDRTFKDRIWPDVSRETYGLFGEVNIDASEVVTVRAGLRADFVESEAAASDSRMMIAPGRSSTILDLYEQYNGPAARTDEAEDTLVSGNLLAEWQISDELSLYGGVGRIVRAPSVTEQYFAFAPAPGGYQVGNPALEPEEKHELAIGGVWTGERGTVEVSAFAAQVNNYIYQTRIDRLDVNGDGTEDNVRGFRNVDAELYGGELGANLALGDGWSLPMSLAYVAGRNTTNDRDLPEIPPLNGQLGLRYDADGQRPWWTEAGLRFASRQDRIDELFPEDETPSWQVVDLRVGVTLAEGLELEAGVENLFDEDYHDHLSREVAVPSGDLRPGDEVPSPGRSVYLTVRMAF